MSCNPSKQLTNANTNQLATVPASRSLNAPTAFRSVSGYAVLVVAAVVSVLAAGCQRSVPKYLNEGQSISRYLDQATRIDYPDVEVPTLDEVTQSHAPMTVIDPDFQSYLDITLESAVSYALQNAKVLRGYGTPSLQGTRVSPGQDNLVNGPAAAGTIYNVAVRETEPGFIGIPGQISNPGSITTNTGLDGNQGVESALADFDAQFTSSLQYTKNDEPRNVTPNNVLTPLVFQQDLVQWQSEIAKKSANGTQIFFRNVNQYTANSNPLDPAGIQVLDSWYRTSFEAEVRQPLLRGRGAFINRMPIVISRIGTDQELANLEAQLQNYVTNVEIRYWDLYCAYRNLDAAKQGRDAALTTWRIVKDQFDEGADVNIQQVAQASEQYHFFDAQVIDAYNSLLNAEGQLRFLLGWASTDGRVLRPSDEPVMAPVEFSWCESLCESLTYRPELRQERWEIKKRELALAYSKNGLLPELNATALYRYLGLGNKFGTSGTSQPFPDVSSGALNEMYGGDYQEASFGAELRMPIGFRRELANVRNAQIKLAREVARLEDMELDISKELTEAFRALAANQMIMQSSFNRWKDTTIEEKHFQELQDAGVETLDVALDAQRRRSQAEIAFYTAMCEYNKVIALIHRRKGTILPYCGVSFSEGPWTGKAYIDAGEHARRRAASKELNYGWTRPEVISRGGNWPTANNVGSSPGIAAEPMNAVTEIPYEQNLGQPIGQPVYESYGTPINQMPGEIINESIGEPMEIQLEGGMYDTPSATRSTVPTNTNPTPAKHDGANVYRDSQVRQTAYAEPVVNDRPRASMVPTQNIKRPERVTAPQPTQRLRAMPSTTSNNSNDLNNVNRISNSTAAQTNSNSTSGNPQPIASTVNWERMGLSGSTNRNQGTVARIKTSD